MKKNILLFFLIALLISTFILPVNIGAEDSIYYYSPYPQGVIGISKPEIGWTVFLGDNEVEDISFLLNGKSIDVIYDKNRETFYGFSEEILHDENSVSAALSIKGWSNVIEQNWIFTVDKSSITALPYPSQKQLSALNYVNDYRYVLNLPLFEFNNSLNMAAQKHADYQANLNIFSHNQIDGYEGFFGESVLERGNYYGFNGNLYEDISYQSDTSIQFAVDSLFDAPYHRIPFLVPYNQYLGYGMNKYYHVLNFGNDKELDTSVVVSPGPNQINVPILWTDNEIPNPLRFYPESTKNVGYPIVVGIYGNHDMNFNVRYAGLWDTDNIEIPIYLNYPEASGGNDNHLDREIIIIPKKPLDSLKTYKVRVQFDIYADQIKETYDKTWYFTTASSANDSVGLIHTQYIYPPLSSGSKIIQFKLGQRYAWVDGLSYPLDVAPFIENNRTMVPIRALGNSLGAYVSWDSATKTVIYEKDNLSIRLPVDTNYANINQTDILLDQGAIIKDGRSYVPIRFISEQLGANVEWIESNREVIIFNNINH